MVTDPTNEVLASAVAIWEVAIKQATGKLRTVPVQTVVEEADAAGFERLPVSFEHAAGIADLPPHHGDPFDRLLISQARAEGLTLATADPAIARYDVAVFAVAREAGAPAG